MTAMINLFFRRCFCCVSVRLEAEHGYRASQAFCLQNKTRYHYGNFMLLMSAGSYENNSSDNLID